MRTIKQLEKEIEEEEKIFGTLDVNAQKRVRKDFERVTKSERLFIIDILETKLQTLKDVCKEIDKTYKDLDMGKTIPIFIQRLKQKFQGEEEWEPLRNLINYYYY